MTNTDGHTLNSGEKFFFWGGGRIYKNYGQGNQIKSSFSWSVDVFVIRDEVFETFIGFDDELAMDNNEYLFLIEQSRIW